MTLFASRSFSHPPRVCLCRNRLHKPQDQQLPTPTTASVVIVSVLLSAVPPFDPESRESRVPSLHWWTLSESRVLISSRFQTPIAASFTISPSSELNASTRAIMFAMRIRYSARSSPRAGLADKSLDPEDPAGCRASP